jgi:hypothetical protein
MAHHHADLSAHPHEHAGHRHLHGLADPAIVTTARGVWALKWSCVGLLVTAGFQLVVVALSGSVALLADSIHNFGAAAMGGLCPGPPTAHRAVPLRLRSP